MARFFVRSELFGAVVQDSVLDRLYFVDDFGLDVFRALSKNAVVEEIKHAAQSHFPESDWAIAFARIEAIGKFLRDANRSKEVVRLVSGLNVESMPQLSAPLDLYWEITRRCNERCVHCYNNSSPEGFNPALTNIEAILDELRPFPLKNITLTGGEPMMRRDFWHIVERMRGMTHELSMGTNGTLIDERNVDRVEENFDTLNVSLDDPDPQEFDFFRGYTGAFERTVKALKVLSNTGIRINIQSVLTRKSISRVRQLGALLREFKVDNWVVRFAFESGRAKEDRSICLSGKEIYDLSSTLANIKGEFETEDRRVTIGANYPWSYEQTYPYVPEDDSYQTCAAATTHAAIDAFGRMAPCSLFTETSYKSASVFGRSFLAEWRQGDQFQEMRNLKRKEVKGCGTCANATGGCGGGCRAKAFMRYGTIKKNDYSCNYSN